MNMRNLETSQITDFLPVYKLNTEFGGAAAAYLRNSVILYLLFIVTYAILRL